MSAHSNLSSIMCNPFRHGQLITYLSTRLFHKANLHVQLDMWGVQTRELSKGHSAGVTYVVITSNNNKFNPYTHLYFSFLNQIRFCGVWIPSIGIRSLNVNHMAYCAAPELLTSFHTPKPSTTSLSRVVWLDHVFLMRWYLRLKYVWLKYKRHL